MMVVMLGVLVSACSSTKARPEKKKEEAAAIEESRKESVVEPQAARPAVLPGPSAVEAVSEHPRTQPVQRARTEVARPVETPKTSNPGTPDALGDQVRPPIAVAPLPPPATAPAPANAAGAPTVRAEAEPATKEITVPAGTLIAVRMIDPVDSASDHVGQTFKASIDSPISIDSQTVIARGADVYVKLTDVKSAGNLKGQSELKLQLDRITVRGKSYTVSSDEYQATGVSQTKQTAKTVGVATAIGAAIGAITGGKKGAVIGAGTGAGAGVGIEAATKGAQVRVESETRLEFRLEQPLDVSIDNRAATKMSPSRTTLSNGPLSGEWEMTIDSFQGRRTVKLVLEQNGSRLHGTMENPMGGETEIRGSVRGTEIVFDADVQNRNQSVRMEFDGTIDHDELRGTMTMMGRKSEWTARRMM